MPPPPPPPPPGAPPPPAPGAAAPAMNKKDEAARAKMLASLQKGSSITKGLRKVPESEKNDKSAPAIGPAGTGAAKGGGSAGNSGGDSVPTGKLRVPPGLESMFGSSGPSQSVLRPTNRTVSETSKGPPNVAPKATAPQPPAAFSPKTSISDTSEAPAPPLMRKPPGFGPPPTQPNLVRPQTPPAPPPNAHRAPQLPSAPKPPLNLPNAPPAPSQQAPRMPTTARPAPTAPKPPLVRPDKPPPPPKNPPVSNPGAQRVAPPVPVPTCAAPPIPRGRAPPAVPQQHPSMPQQNGPPPPRRSGNMPPQSVDLQLSNHSSDDFEKRFHWIDDFPPAPAFQNFHKSYPSRSAKSPPKPMSDKPPSASSQRPAVPPPAAPILHH